MKKMAHILIIPFYIVWSTSILHSMEPMDYNTEEFASNGEWLENERQAEWDEELGFCNFLLRLQPDTHELSPLALASTAINIQPSSLSGSKPLQTGSARNWRKKCQHIQALKSYLQDDFICQYAIPDPRQLGVIDQQHARNMEKIYQEFKKTLENKNIVHKIHNPTLLCTYGKICRSHVVTKKTEKRPCELSEEEEFFLNLVLIFEKLTKQERSRVNAARSRESKKAIRIALEQAALEKYEKDGRVIEARCQNDSTLRAFFETKKKGL